MSGVPDLRGTPENYGGSRFRPSTFARPVRASGLARRCTPPVAAHCAVPARLVWTWAFGVRSVSAAGRGNSRRVPGNRPPGFPPIGTSRSGCSRASDSSDSVHKRVAIRRCCSLVSLQIDVRCPPPSSARRPGTCSTDTCQLPWQSTCHGPRCIALPCVGSREAGTVCESAELTGSEVCCLPPFFLAVHVSAVPIANYFAIDRSSSRDAGKYWPLFFFTFRSSRC